ncbi:TetR/AcrR family transcriptional regulator [Prescottella defluvii]|uniref:TetR/AcrR family transcriptional regulator n=1 Tax=Prescottella defluvii TaxID=1323361 RepID=UPI0004F3169B|nr:TetR/AcrR family transcriptional regulator [Prescottella defluvii]
MTPTDTKARLVETFARHLATNGYAGLSLIEVVQEVGIKRPSLYHHFPGGKDALYAAAAHDFIDRQHEKLQAGLASDGDLTDRLVAIVRAVADPSGAQVSFDQRLFDALPLVDDPIRDEVSRAYVTKLLDPVEAVIRDAVEARELAGDEGFLTNALLHLARATDLRPDDDSLAPKLVALFLNGAHTVGA